MWAVFRAYPWSSLEVLGSMPLMAPKDGPQRFIPLFDTRDQALEFTGGDDTNIFRMAVRPEPTEPSPSS